MTRMTGPDCVVMCNLINTYIHTYIHTYIDTYFIHTNIRVVNLYRDKVREVSTKERRGDP